MKRSAAAVTSVINQEAAISTTVITPNSTTEFQEFLSKYDMIFSAFPNYSNEFDLLPHLLFDLVEKMMSNSQPFTSSVIARMLLKLKHLFSSSIFTVKICYAASNVLDHPPGKFDRNTKVFCIRLLGECAKAMGGLPPFSTKILDSLCESDFPLERWFAALALYQNTEYSLKGSYSMHKPSDSILFLKHLLPPGEHYYLDRIGENVDNDVNVWVPLVCSTLLPALKEYLPSTIYNEAIKALCEILYDASVMQPLDSIQLILPYLGSDDIGTCALAKSALEAATRPRKPPHVGYIVHSHTPQSETLGLYLRTLGSIKVCGDKGCIELMRVMAQVVMDCGSGMDKYTIGIKKNILEETIPYFWNNQLCIEALNLCICCLRKLDETELYMIQHAIDSVLLAKPILSPLFEPSKQIKEEAKKRCKLVSNALVDLAFCCDHIDVHRYSSAILINNFVFEKLEKSAMSSARSQYDVALLLSKISRPFEMAVSDQVELKERLYDLLFGVEIPIINPSTKLALLVALFRCNSGSLLGQKKVTAKLEELIEQNLVFSDSWWLYRLAQEALTHGYCKIASALIKKILNSENVTDGLSEGPLLWLEALSYVAEGYIPLMKSEESSLSFRCNFCADLMSKAEECLTLINGFGNSSVARNPTFKFQMDWLRASREFLELVAYAYVACQESAMKVKSDKPNLLRSDIRIRRLPKAFLRAENSFKAVLRSCIGFDGHTIATLRGSLRLCKLLFCASDLFIMGIKSPKEGGKFTVNWLKMMSGGNEGGAKPGQLPITALIRRVSFELLSLIEKNFFKSPEYSPAIGMHALASILISVQSLPCLVPRRFFSIKPSAQILLSVIHLPIEMHDSSKEQKSANQTTLIPLVEIPWNEVEKYPCPDIKFDRKFTDFKCGKENALLLQGRICGKNDSKFDIQEVKFFMYIREEDDSSVYQREKVLSSIVQLQKGTLNFISKFFIPPWTIRFPGSYTLNFNMATGTDKRGMKWTFPITPVSKMHVDFVDTK